MQFPDTHWPVYLVTNCVCIWRHIIHGRNEWIHSPLWSWKLNSIREERLLFPLQITTSGKRRAELQNKDQIHSSPSYAELNCGLTDLDGAHFFFFLGGQNKFQACLCCSKNQLNTKVERRTKTSFTVPLQADNHKDSEPTMHTGTKAEESDNLIYHGLLLSSSKNCAAEPP